MRGSKTLAISTILVLFFGSAAGQDTSRLVDGHRDISGVWLRTGGMPRMEAPMQPWAQEVFERTAAEMRARDGSDLRPRDPDVALREVSGDEPFIGNRLLCLPEGPVDMLIPPYDIQLIHQLDKVYMLTEWGNKVRIIYLDEQHPPNLKPSWNGHSVGHWEGETLVVDTVGLDERAPLLSMRGAVPRSDALHIVERITVSEDGDTITAEVMIEDPKVFTQPWSMNLTWLRRPDPHVYEFVCADAPLDLAG